MAGVSTKESLVEGLIFEDVTYSQRAEVVALLKTQPKEKIQSNATHNPLPNEPTSIGLDFYSENNPDIQNQKPHRDRVDALLRRRVGIKPEGMLDYPWRLQRERQALLSMELKGYGVDTAALEKRATFILLRELRGDERHQEWVRFFDATTRMRI